MTEIPKPSITAVFEHYGAQVIGADRGGWQKATCALNDHDDKSPSASINEEDCRWHCWTCDKSGDAVDLVMANEGLEFREAIEFINKTFASERVDNDSSSNSLNPRRGARAAVRGKWTAPWAKL